jgi:uncharacterized repeat protein (TIGR01451 family)
VSVWNTGLDVNDAGDVVGYGYPLDSQDFRIGPDRAVLWRGGVALDIGTLGGVVSRAIAVNDAGQVIGNAQIADGSYHAFLWQNGVIADLGAFEATAISSAGEVIGAAAGRAVIWDNGVLTDLNDRIPAGGGWVLNRAITINDNGQIGGQGTLNGVTSGFLLFPDSLSIRHADLALSVVPVGPARFGFNLTNLGPDTASSTNLVVEVHDASCPVDDGLRPCPGTPYLTLSQGGACTHRMSHNYVANAPASIWCAVGDLAVGQSVTGELAWDQLGELTQLTLDATLFAVELDSSIVNNTTTVTVPRAAADIAVTMTDSPDPVSIGQSLTYTAQIVNNGPDAAGSVSFVSSKPSGVTHVSASASQGICQGTTPVNCSLGDLASGATVTITMVAIPTTAGTVNRIAVVQSSSTDPNTANNSATVATTVTAPQADLALIMSDSPDPVLVGGTVTYTITATNNGPSTATNVTATGTLPSCSLGTIVSGASASCTATATANAVGTLTQTMSVSAIESDPNTDNNSASASTTVNPVISADLAVTMSDSPDPVKKGAKLTYNITVRNNGPQAASGVVLTDSLPANIIFVQASTTKGSCQGTSTVTCSLGSLASGASANVKIVIKPISAGTISNSASVASSVADPNGANNSATATTTVKK